VKYDRLAVFLVSIFVLVAHGFDGQAAGAWGMIPARLGALLLSVYVVKSLWRQETSTILPASLAGLSVTYALVGLVSSGATHLAYPLIYGFIAALAVVVETKTVVLVICAAVLVEVLHMITDSNAMVRSLAHIGSIFAFAAAFAFLLRGRALVLKRQQSHQIASTLMQVEQDARDFRLSESLRPGSQLPAIETSASLGSQHRRWLGSVRAIRDALHDVLELARLSVDADTVLYFAYDEAHRALKLKASIPDDESPSTMEQPLSSTEGALGAVIKTKAPVRMLPKEPGRHLGHPAQRKACAFLGVPMIEGQKLRGVLVANRLAPSPFGEDDEKRFEVIAGEVLRAVESERIFANLDRVRHEQERFFDAFALLNRALKPDAVATCLLEAVDRIKTLDFAAVTGYDPQSEEHTILRLRTSVSGKRKIEGTAYRNTEGGLVVMALKNGRPLPYVPLTEQETTGPLQIFGRDGRFDLKSVKVFPMTNQNYNVGTLVVGSHERGAELSKAEFRMLETVVVYAAATLSNAAMYRKMETMATTDGLTGLNNRRRFLELVEEAIARAERFGRRVSILMVDADHFKAVNDRYGHPVGDIVLKRIADVLSQEARRVDVVGRFGGEEFIAMLDETNMAGALQVAERMRQQIEESMIQGEFGQVKVTVSMGLATYPDHGDSVGELIDEADKALYDAKAQGRNQVRVAAGQRCADPKKPGKSTAQDRART
jgi:two-component system, cell cycle response regulator